MDSQDKQELSHDSIKAKEDFLISHGGRHAGLFDQTKNIHAAAARVFRAAITGKAIRVEEEELQYRLSVCRSCDLWDEGGNVGLGKCNHPGCGCTRMKHGFATERCPLKKWNYEKKD